MTIHLCDRWVEIVQPIRTSHPWINHALDFVRDHGQPGMEMSVQTGWNGFYGLPTAHFGKSPFAQLGWKWSEVGKREVLAWWYGDGEWDHLGPVIQFGTSEQEFAPTITKIKTARDYLENRIVKTGKLKTNAERKTAIVEYTKELSVKKWFVAFFAGIATNWNQEEDNAWLDKEYGDIQFDLIFTPSGVKLCHDYWKTGGWQNQSKSHLLYADYTAGNLVEELETIFAGLAQKVKR